MRPPSIAIAGTLAVAALLLSTRAPAQTAPDAPVNRTISVTGGRPVAAAMDVIEKRYGVLIDYVDPPYASSRDIAVAHYRPGHVTPVPKSRSLSVGYTQIDHGPERIPYLSCNAATLGCAPVDAWPQRGVTALIQSVLNRFVAQGGQTFLVRKLDMPYGPRWEVFPEEARDRSGTVRYQPDLLGASVLIPDEGRAAGAEPANDLIRSIYQQLEAKWGSEFRVAGIPAGSPAAANAALEGEDVTGWQALARFMGPGWVLRLYYAPDNGEYYPNMERLPYRPPPRPPTPTPAPARLAPPIPRPPGDWLFMARTPKGVLQIERALSEAGFLHSAPSGKWDANAAAALRGFQQSGGLPSTGKLDTLTVLKLEAYLPMYRPLIPPKPAVDPALFYWLDSTRRGWTEIQEALKKAGFYSGPATGRFDAPTRAALKAFQKDNGISPAQGIFDDRTAQKLAPFLPKPKP